jgi:hypothetical protein
MAEAIKQLEIALLCIQFFLKKLEIALLTCSVLLHLTKVGKDTMLTPSLANQLV